MAAMAYDPGRTANSLNIGPRLENLLAKRISRKCSATLSKAKHHPLAIEATIARHAREVPE
jgi:hypothetical protein